MSIITKKKTATGIRSITESGIIYNENVPEHGDRLDCYEVVNTLLMSKAMNDEDSMEKAAEGFVRQRFNIKNEMELM